MKKIAMFILAAVMMIGTTNAKAPIKYHGEVDLGYSIGVGTFATGRVNIHTVQGVEIGRYFSTGIGIGVDIYHESPDVMVPIYLNLKGYLPVSEIVKPYLSVDIGAGVGASSGVSGLSGATYTIAAGVKVKRFKAQLGYNVQRISESGIGVNMNAVQIKLGVMF